MAGRKQKIPTTTTLSVRLPIEHKEAIEKAAVEAKTTTSAYAARVLVEAATGKAPAPAKTPEPEIVEAPKPSVAKGIVLSDPKALDELRRIGVNINQIAHALNAGRPTRDGTLASETRELFALLSDPDAFMRAVQQIPLPPVGHPESKPSPPPAPVTPSPKLSASPSIEAPLPPARIPVPDIMTVLTPQGVARDELEKAIKALATSPAASSPVPEPGAQPSEEIKRRRQYREIPTGSPRRGSPVTLPEVNKDGEPSISPRPFPPYAAGPAKPAVPQPVTKEVRRDSTHPQTRHQLQDRAPLRPARPGSAEDHKPGRLGFLSKLWGR